MTDEDIINPEVMTEEDLQKQLHNKKEEHISKFKKYLLFEILDSLTPTIIIVTYVVLGCCLKTPLGVNGINAWAAFWPLFFFLPIPHGLLATFRDKRVHEFPILFILLMIYCFLGMLGGLWHPYWAILFIAPLFHGLVSRIKAVRSK